MKKVILGLFAVAMFFTTLKAQDDFNSTTVIKAGDKMPAFSTLSLDGKTFSSESLKGKVTLINFWATWCGPCQKELPLLQKDIFEKLSSKGLEVLAISRGEKEEVVKKFIDQKKYTFPVYLDSETKTYNLFATKFIPRNFVIGKDGLVKWATMGFTEEEFSNMIKLIEEELKK